MKSIITHLSPSILKQRSRAYPLFALMLVILCLTVVAPVSAQTLQITQLQPLNGAPGTSFTIYGSGFDGAADNTVSFTPAATIP